MNFYQICFKLTKVLYWLLQYESLVSISQINPNKEQPLLTHFNHLLNIAPNDNIFYCYNIQSKNALNNEYYVHLIFQVLARRLKKNIYKRLLRSKTYITLYTFFSLNISSGAWFQHKKKTRISLHKLKKKLNSCMKGCSYNL